MVRTQIQLPDELYRKLKQVAESEEWSLTETIRRAAEVLVGAYPRAGEAKKPWRFPDPVDLGELLLPPEKWADALEQDRLNHIMGRDDDGNL